MHSPQRYDVVILGAGIAGLFAADKLATHGRRVAVVERSSVCGGAHQATTIAPYTFDHGSIFYEEAASIFDLAPGIREACPQVFRQQRRIGPNGDVLHYPVEPRELLKASWSDLLLSVIDLAFCRIFIRRDGSLSKIIRQQMGRRFLRLTGLENYIVRFHHVGADRIDERFFFKRMSFIARSTEVMTLIRTGFRALTSRKPQAGVKRRPLRIRPYSGFGAIFDPIRKQLEDRGVAFHLGETIETIRRVENGYIAQTDKASFSAECLVNTIPLGTLHQALFNEAAGLVLLDMTVLFVSAESLAPSLGNVLFNFHGAGQWKRATIYSRLYPEAETQREFFAVEVTIPQDGMHDPEAAFADFAAHIEGLGFASGCRLEGSVFHPDCYPLYLHDTDERIDAALARIAAEGIVTVGRQGRFEYLPTSSGVIKQARRELDRA